MVLKHLKIKTQYISLKKWHYAQKLVKVILKNMYFEKAFESKDKTRGGIQLQKVKNEVSYKNTSHMTIFSV